METLKERFTQQLVNEGMQEDAAKVVMEIAVNDERLLDITNHWGQAANAFPPYLMSAIWYDLHTIALEWIVANETKAFIE